MSDIKRLLSGAYILGYSDARNDKAIDVIGAIERLTMNLNKSDLISRQDAIKALGEEPEVWCDTVETLDEYSIGARNQWQRDVDAIKALPSAEQSMTATSNTVVSDTVKIPVMDGTTERLPSAESENRLAKITDLVEGTIDHFDLDDAMDLLYQIKEVLK